jgi:hypothetical protein
MTAGGARGQRDTRLEPLQFDTRAGAGAQQAIGGLPEARTTLDRVVCQSRIERCKKSADIAVYPLAQCSIDEIRNLSALLRFDR